MGKMLINGFVSRMALAPQDILVSTRTKEKLTGLADSHPKIVLAKDNGEVARLSDLLFLCVKPLEVKGVLENIREYLKRSNPNIVSIAACVTLDYLARIHPGRYTKVIPSLTSEIGCGISLLCHGPGVAQSEAIEIERLFGSISTVKSIQEGDFEAAADLTSCAPGMIAEIFRQFAEAGTRHSRLSLSDAEEMAISTLYGTAKLLLEGRMNFQDMITRVATKGGITEEGIKQLRSGLPPVFDDVFHATLGKHETVKALLSATMIPPLV